jgi:hypothetical protein
MNEFRYFYLLAVAIFCGFQSNAYAQNKTSINLPSGIYYFDEFGEIPDVKTVRIANNQIILETTTRWKDVYTDVYKVINAYEYGEKQYFLLTETEDAGEISHYKILLEYHENAIYISISLYSVFDKKKYFDRVTEIKKLEDKANINSVYNSDFSGVTPYFTKNKYEALKKLPTITEDQLPEFTAKVIQQYFSDENDFNDFLHDRNQARVKSVQNKLSLFNFLIENGFEPYNSNLYFYNYATSSASYLKKGKEIRKANRSGTQLFFDKIESWSKIVGSISLAWLAMALLLALKNKNSNEKKLLLPKFLKPIFSIITIPGFVIIGGYLGFRAGWGFAQLVTPNNDGGLADIFLALIGILPGLALPIFFIIWINKKWNKYLYKTT